MQMESNPCQEQQGGGLPNWAFAALLSAVVALLFGGAWFYSLQELELKHGAEEDLASIAKFKVGQIDNWQRERLGDAFVIMESPFLAQGVERFLKNPHADGERDLRQRLQSLKTHYLYQDILLVDAEGEVRIRLGQHDYLRQELGQALERSFTERRPVFTDIHTDDDADNPHISIVAPLFSSQASSARLLGAVVLLMPAKQYLYPLMHAWPTHSSTAETFLVRRDGDHALFLNELRHQPGAALKLKISLSQTDDPAAMAILGSRGLVRGHDYRGHDVLAFSIEVPGTAWIMVSKMDADEVYSAWRRQSLLIFTLFACILAVLVGTSFLLWQRKQKEYFQAQFLAEARLRESLELQGITLSSIGDGVICTDTQGRVTLLNPVAERLTGWSLEEARGKMFDEVFRIIHEETRQHVQSPVARVLAEGITVELANHTVLITGEGSERPIADSAAPIRNDCGDILGAVLVFRDCSAEHAAQKTKEALYATEMRYRELVENAQSIILKVDTSGHITYFNEYAQKVFGYTKQEIVGRHVVGTIVPAVDSASADMRGMVGTILAKPEEHYRVENENTRRDGNRIWVSWSNKPLYDENGHPSGMLSVGTDITERKEAEDALRKSELALRSVLDGLSANIALLDDQGTILLTNMAWREFAQQNGTKAETVSEGANYLSVCAMASGGNAEEASQFAEGIRSVLDGKSTAFKMEYPCDSQTDRRWFVGRVTLFPGDVPRRVIVAHEDITERKVYELELLKLRRGIENSTATIVITNRNGVIEYVNPAFTATTGYTPEEAIGQNPRVLKSGAHDAAFYTEMWQTLTAGKTWRGDISNRKKNGQLFWEHASISPIKGADGEIVNFVAVKDDISDKKDLERIKEDVERIMRHDLKTPLNGIIGVPQILAYADNLTEEQRELVKAIENSGMRMLHMIDSSLDLFKMETGKYVYAPKPVDALVLIDQLGQQYRSSMSARTLSLCVSVDGNPATPEMSFVIGSAEGLLYTLLGNLISNAVEASPGGTHIVVELASNEPKTIAIRNRGVVPQAIHENFFEKYKTHGKSFGTGLGTYSAKLIAGTMGYGIQMQTSDEEGTTCVSISIPTME